MPVTFVVKTSKQGNSVKMVVPAEICRGFGIKAGDYLMITARDAEFSVKKVRK